MEKALKRLILLLVLHLPFFRRRRAAGVRVCLNGLDLVPKDKEPNRFWSGSFLGILRFLRAFFFFANCCKHRFSFRGYAPANNNLCPC